MGDPDRIGAFGDAEGSRARIADVMRDFVEFDDGPARSDLAFDSQHLLRSRVIVGGKGTGKSVYLRRLQAMASNRATDGAIYSDQDSLYADDIQQDVPTTESVVRVSDWYEPRYLTEKWQWLWRRAIMRSLISHLLCVPRLRDSLSAETIEELTEQYTPHLYRRFTKPLSIYSQLRHIINKPVNQGGMNRYLEHEAWDDLEATLGGALRGCPAICFYIDAIDDEFAHAPAYWLTCQKGLFHEVMRLLRDPVFGGKLHVIICIRDVVFSSILRSEHADRFRDSPHIRMLTWDHESLQYFLRAKLEQISDSYLLADHEGDSEKIVQAWLGLDTIHNTRREKHYDEQIEDYLLRHIRPLPRDIVILGNRLCRVTKQAKETYVQQLSQAWITNVVAQAARQFGELQLTICANQLAADLMYPNSADHGAENAAAYAPAINEQLKHFIHDAIGRDRFDNPFCKQIMERARVEFPTQTDVLSVLWQNGLLGYGTGDMYDGETTFYRLDDRAEQLILPLDRDFYVLHSCLIDSAEVSTIGGPVFPFRRRIPYSEPNR
jgi:hypothetical protein